MIIGVPKEIKTREYRVGMTPAGVRSLTSARPQGARREERRRRQRHQGRRRTSRAGAHDRRRPRPRPGRAEMVVKVKEPLPAEYGFFREDLDPLHVPPPRGRARAHARSSREKKVRGVAYETIELDDGSLPLLRPMSEVAGRMAVQVGATCLEKEHGGKGVLLGGVPGTRRGRVVILGGGVVGRNAATIAIGMGAQVTVLDVRAETMALPRGRLRRRRRDALLEPDQHRAGRHARRPRRRRRARHRRARAEARHRGAHRQDGEGQRRRRRRRRSGRLHRDLPPDDARQPDLRGRRRRPLLRRQHAGRGRADEHVGAHQHDDRLRA